MTLPLLMWCYSSVLCFSCFPLRSVPVVFFHFSSVSQCSCQHDSQGHQGSARQQNSMLIFSSILSPLVSFVFVVLPKNVKIFPPDCRSTMFNGEVHSYRAAFCALAWGPILSPSQKPLVPSKAGFLSYQIKVQAWGSLLPMNQTRTLQAPAMAHRMPIFASSVREHAE